MANIWKQFESLLEKDSTMVALVVSTTSTNVKVELLSGDRMNVLPGSDGASPGDMVYIKGGQIIQKAPAPLPRHDLILY